MASAAFRVAGIKSSKSPDDSPAHVNDLDKPSGDARVQSQASVRQDHGASTTGGGHSGRRQQASDINGSTAAPNQRQPLSASTPGKPLPGTPAVPANRDDTGTNSRKSTPVPAAKCTLTPAASDVARKRNTHQVPQSAASERASQHEAVAESPGIITSATIARLASHSATQQPMNGKSSTTLPAPPGRGRVQATLPPPAVGKRKSTEAHQQRPDSSGQGGQSNPPLPSSQASSPSSSSPDQPAAGKRKKIMWDPQVAQSQQATGAATAQAQRAQQAEQAQQLPPSDGLQPPAAKHVQTQQSAPTAPCTTLNIQLPPNSSLVQPPRGARQPSQTAAQAADKQVDKQSPCKEKVGRSAGQGTEQAGLDVGVTWSWGPGAAVQGRFDAALVSMMPGSVGDQQPGRQLFLSLLECFCIRIHTTLVIMPN